MEESDKACEIPCTAFVTLCYTLQDEDCSYVYLQVMIFIGHFIKTRLQDLLTSSFYLLMVPFGPRTPGKTVLIFTKGSPYFCMGKLEGPGNEASLSYADLATAAGDTVCNTGLSIQR